MTGIEGKVTIDGTNAARGRSDFAVGPPTIDFANIYDEIGAQRVPPSNLYCADDEAREVAEQLIRDAGYEPVSAGALDRARLLEDHLELLFAVNQAGLGPFFVRYAKPGEL